MFDEFIIWWVLEMLKLTIIEVKHLYYAKISSLLLKWKMFNEVSVLLLIIEYEVVVEFFILEPI